MTEHVEVRPLNVWPNWVKIKQFSAHNDWLLEMSCHPVVTVVMLTAQFLKWAHYVMYSTSIFGVKINTTGCQ